MGLRAPPATRMTTLNIAPTSLHMHNGSSQYAACGAIGTAPHCLQRLQRCSHRCNTLSTALPVALWVLCPTATGRCTRPLCRARMHPLPSPHSRWPICHTDASAQPQRIASTYSSVLCFEHCTLIRTLATLPHGTPPGIPAATAGGRAVLPAWGRAAGHAALWQLPPLTPAQSPPGWHGC
jgi:hypothetical protein